ncbi:hypothetical protein OEZ85_011882 [Tetradesmus obliquus]|uniref:Domain of unknown function at the cortex 1 domain-containing protein n=1 Tax=Tetradesmus obliquus TaxID=3088 RepID=A0ABY8TRM9_TETOB|nr:hypothetical protein OEZ85_011882 [Tetradesmus obliquus]
MPSQEQLQNSLNSPVIVTPNPMVKQQEVNGRTDPTFELPINSGPMTINTSMFEGTLEVHLKGLPTSQKRVFEGKKRFFQIMCQGRFKRAVDADGLCMGQEFVKAGNVPPWVGEMVLTAAAKVFSSSTQVDIYAKLPYFMNPVLAACQMVNVALPGSEPSLTEATEDMRLFAPELADKTGAPLSPEKRRKWCDVPKHLAGKQFSTEHVYTFHIWQHLIDFSTYKLSVGGFVNLDLTHALNCQPLQLTCKDTHADEYMFSMLVWHERLLYADDTSAAAALAERLSRWGAGFRSLMTGGSSSSNSAGKK